MKREELKGGVAGGRPGAIISKEKGLKSQGILGRCCYHAFQQILISHSYNLSRESQIRILM